MKTPVDELKSRAAKHETRSQFKRQDRPGFNSARSQGLLDMLFPNSTGANQKLSVAELRERAGQCRKRTEFRKKYDSAYASAKKQGLLDVLFPRRPKPEPKPAFVKKEKVIKVRTLRKITESLVREIAAGFQKRSHFETADKTAYNWAVKSGLLAELFPKKLMACGSKETFVKKATLKHGDKYDYSQVRYERCDKKVKLICKEHGEFWQRPQAHLGGSGCRKCWSFDNDSIYIKRLLGETFNGLQIYKVGITSHRLGVARLLQQDRSSKLEHEVILAPTKLVGAATDVEKFALTLGVNPRFLPFDGSTEYRAYTEADLQSVLDMIELCQQ